MLAAAGPRQAEVLYACAVPRWFDAGVLAVLRGRDDGNERVLDLLAGYSFVRPIGAGRYAYPDDVRAALLAEWREMRPRELRTLNLRLADHFARRVAAATPDARERLEGLPTAATAQATGNWELWSRESIYHLLMADPPSGLAKLRAQFDLAESSYRLAEAEALLKLAEDTPLDREGRLWLRLMRARLDVAALRLAEGSAELEALLAEPSLDPALAAAARRALAGVLAETGQWARAVEQYRASLQFYAGAGDRRGAAEVMLRLGEAYRGLGIDTGGWYVPAFPRSPFWRALGQAWYALLALPFVLAAALLRRTPWALPRPRHLASYHNWLLARLYRTALGWYDRARAAFAEQDDQAGLLRADRQRAEIVLLFGYAEEALARLDELLARPAAQDAYLRLWIEGDRALALIELGRLEEARDTLAAPLAGFRAIGDYRGEAAMLALQGRAAEDGAADAAIESYRASLARFRALRYAAARELALYALRAWQRRASPGAIAQRAGELLDQEPEKRYVARFPRSLLPFLQALVLGIFPLALLLASLVAPTQVARAIGSTGIVEIQNVYNLWNVAATLATIGLLALAIYTAIGLALIFLIPLDALEREQPDYLVTDERGIARYDYRGALAQRMGWAEIARWVRADRRLWQRPAALFSLAFLEAADGRDLRIDGITGWYTGLQRDIALHLREAGSPTRAEDWGYTLLRSKSGALLLLGVGLLLLCISAANDWSDWMLALPPRAYAAISLLALSGILIFIPLAYWLVARPLALARARPARPLGLGRWGGWPGRGAAVPGRRRGGAARAGAERGRAALGRLPGRERRLHPVLPRAAPAWPRAHAGGAAGRVRLGLAAGCVSLQQHARRGLRAAARPRRSRPAAHPFDGVAVWAERRRRRRARSDVGADRRRALPAGALRGHGRSIYSGDQPARQPARHRRDPPPGGHSAAQPRPGAPRAERPALAARRPGRVPARAGCLPRALVQLPEAALCAGKQALDVGAVEVDDQRAGGPDEDRVRQRHLAVEVEERPQEQHHPRGRERGHRRDARDQEGERPGRHAERDQQREDRQDDAGAGRHRFAALESEENREGVAQDRPEAHQDRHCRPARQQPQRRQSRQRAL
jgi:hypothetical protein